MHDFQILVRCIFQAVVCLPRLAWADKFLTMGVLFQNHNGDHRCVESMTKPPHDKTPAHKTSTDKTSDNNNPISDKNPKLLNADKTPTF